ncbi:MAG: IS3 family transposase [Clostridia bacterium]|nr:IS3 family transposase [Clostridia bacterium]
MKIDIKNLKQNVIIDIKNNIKIKTILNKYNLPKSTLYYWLKQGKDISDYYKKKSVTYQDYEKLKKERDRLSLELQIFKDLHCFTDATTKEKETAISKFVGKYPIKAMCRLLEIPKGTVYNYLLRKTKVTQYQVRDEELKQEIYRVFKESEERFGAKKILAKLRSEGINTTMKKVQSLMLLLNIKSKQKLIKSEPAKKDESAYYVNKLKRLFNQDAPNKYWVSDVTELKISKNKFYLCVILDLFSRKVIAYRLSTQNNTSLTINTFKDAYENRNRPAGLSFHSDQGSNYTAYEFKDLLRLLKVEQSFSHKGNPYDNACMESFFSTFKREEYNTKIYNDFDDMGKNIDSYMKYYNEYRPHQTLKDKTPNQFESDYFEKIDKEKSVG